jgi:hypothetical protein
MVEERVLKSVIENPSIHTVERSKLLHVGTVLIQKVLVKYGLGKRRERLQYACKHGTWQPDCLSNSDLISYMTSLYELSISPWHDRNADGRRALKEEQRLVAKMLHNRIACSATE